MSEWPWCTHAETPRAHATSAVCQAQCSAGIAKAEGSIRVKVVAVGTRTEVRRGGEGEGAGAQEPSARWTWVDEAPEALKPLDGLGGCDNQR